MLKWVKLFIRWPFILIIDFYSWSHIDTPTYKFHTKIYRTKKTQIIIIPPHKSNCLVGSFSMCFVHSLVTDISRHISDILGLGSGPRRSDSASYRAGNPTHGVITGMMVMCFVGLMGLRKSRHTDRSSPVSPSAHGHVSVCWFAVPASGRYCRLRHWLQHTTIVFH